MPAELKTPWLVLAWCCCLIMSAQAIRGSNDSREEHSPSMRTDAREEFLLSKMLFTYTNSEPGITGTTLKMCSEAALSNTPDDSVVTVVFGTPATQEYSVEGKLVDDGSCAEFIMAYFVPETTEPITYTLVVDEGTLKTSTVTFAMTVDVTVLSCSPRELSRVSWRDIDTTIEGECIENATPDMVCYIDRDLTTEEVCFKTVSSADMVVCRQGGVIVTSDPSQISVNYLAYDPVSPDPASLSLLFNDDSEKSLEVTLWRDLDAPLVLTCDGACTLTPFVSSNAVYEMCAFLNKGVLRGPQSGFASVQDVKLVAYDMGEEDQLAIEYFFTNSNTASRLYIASVFTGPTPAQPVATTHHNCVGVAVTHLCIGRIVTTSQLTTESTYLSVEYTDELFENPTNMVAVKLQALPSRGRNFSSVRDPINSAKGSKGYSTTNS